MMAAYAFRFISLRYAASPDWGETLGLLVNAFIDATGTIPNNLLNNSEAAAYGNSVAEAINAAYLADGANQQGNYANTCYEPVNAPLDVTEEGLCTFTLEDPNRWQPLSFGGSFVDQAGNETFQDVVPGDQVPIPSGASGQAIAASTVVPSKPSVSNCSAYWPVLKWCRLRAWTLGRARSLRMASSRISFHVWTAGSSD